MNDTFEEAADKGHLDVVQALLASGAQPAQSPNALAAGADVVRALLASGAQPAQSPNALVRAADNGHLDVVRALLASGAQPAQSPNALVWAAGNGTLTSSGPCWPAVLSPTPPTNMAAQPFNTLP